MKAIVLKCTPGSSFHFGKYAPDSDTALNDSDELMHSDSLFAALVNTYEDCFGDANEFVEVFKDKLRISSLFYCLQHNGEYIWLLPKPVCFSLIQTKDSKAFRNIRYISKKVWENIKEPKMLINNPQLFLSDKNVFAAYRDELIQEGSKENIVDDLTKLKLFSCITLPKVTVRADTEDQGIYQLTVTEIADNSKYVEGLKVHYYFLMDDSMLDDKMKANTEAVIKMLAYTGIGAERSTIGRIEDVEIISNWEIKGDDWDKNHDCSISLFSPTTDEEMNKMVYYKTIMRGGRRIGKTEGYERKEPLFLKSIRMATEGAILTKGLQGDTKLISPEGHKNIFLRYGKPFCLPVHTQWLNTTCDKQP